MNRHDLMTVLCQDNGAAANAARVELQAGARFAVLGASDPISARRLWAVWSARHQALLETGTTPPAGMAEALRRLHAEGTCRVYMARITGSQRSFKVFLSGEDSRLVACW